MSDMEQSDRLAKLQKEGHGAASIFHEEARTHDKEVGYDSLLTIKELETEFPMLKFRYRKFLTKKEINKALQRIDKRLGQTLFVDNAEIRPDGGLIEVKDDNGRWRVVLVSEAKYQGKDIENISTGKLVGKNNDKDIMEAGNAIERAYKNISEIANFMLDEHYFPYVLFLEGSNFLTQNVTVVRPDGREVTLSYRDGRLNRLDRLTAANYGMPINTNLCQNSFIKCSDITIMLQAASIYTKGEGSTWNDEEIVKIMLDTAKTSLKVLASDIFEQLSKY